MTTDTLNTLATRVHLANKRWWTNLDTGEPSERNVGELLMLIISELSEALEAHRKDLQDDKLPHRKMFEVELADTLIRTLDMIGGLQLSSEAVSTSGVAFSENTAENLLQLVRIYIIAYACRDTARLLAMCCARAICALEELAARMSLDLMGAFEEKLMYNSTRHDHSIAGRLAAGGKKY